MSTAAANFLTRLIEAHPHRWAKALGNRNTRDWFAAMLAENTVTEADGSIRETTPQEDASAFAAASAVVEARLKMESES